MLLLGLIITLPLNDSLKYTEIASVPQKHLIAPRTQNQKTLCLPERNNGHYIYSIYLYMHIYIHIYVYMCVRMCVCVCLRLKVFTLPCLAAQMQSHFSAPPGVTNSFICSDGGKKGTCLHKCSDIKI